ncbi:YegS/Rv2252/BmrU family lipid kinase [Halanaerobium hydrogeniformans]|uniref:Diacylglycerol kinase catalytic region n=1 Tax=Halanaerobium hydrogeniformans TaxID=656519 RepID=E4RM88_HALHG|nr:YegS/Rv2252/BmrU family lipid kinase [Halanaerobium hydrogeniformans]ADQ14419.1 diacylglycerol kinase catalytic region [Halanaerobium hydrogeniformans]
MGNKVKFIYNPAAGDRSVIRYLDTFFEKFQSAGFKLDVYRSMEEGDFSNGLNDLSKEYKAIIIAGGDGSASNVINIMQQKNIELPLGIIPTGTANDFASYIGMSENIERSIDIILNWNIREVDIGKVNDRYFLNVCAGGIISNIAHRTETEMKNRLGKVAYYLYGLKELPNIKPMSLKITTSQTEISGNYLAFFIFNSKDAGGFKNIAQFASIDDGLFDLIAVESANIIKISSVIADLLQGKNINDENIFYVQDNYFKIEKTDTNIQTDHCDIDGEKGPEFPLEIELLPKALKIISA